MALPPEVRLTIIVAVWIAGALTAWELKGRLKRRNEKLNAELADGLLEAFMQCTDANKTVRSTATVRLDRGIYEVEILSIEDGAESVIVRKTFNDRDALETFLIENTKFRLGDFVRR
jgi:hypothetical protein